MCLKEGWKYKDIAEVTQMNRLYSYAMSLARHPTEAQDLVQETYVRAISAIEGLRDDSNITSWLCTILRNIWLNQLRTKRSRPEIVEMDEGTHSSHIAADTSRNAHDLYVTELERVEVQAAIQQLDQDSRELIILREYDELSYQEIARVLGCPMGTVMSRLSRARAKLRTALLTTPHFRNISNREGV